jgi:hypothetical protein
MKSIMLELIPIDPGFDKFLDEMKKSHQVVPDAHIINRIKQDSIENIAEGKEYKVFENAAWLITGKIDDEEVGSIWVEVFKKQ